MFCACHSQAERWEEPRLPGKEAAERGDQFLDVDGLGQEAVHAAFQRTLPVLLEGVSRHGEDRNFHQCRVRQRPDLSGGLAAVHKGHLHVHQHQIVVSGFGLLDFFHGFHAVFRRIHHEAVFAEDLHGDFPVQFVVLRQQDVLAAEIREKATAWAVAWGSVEEIDEHNILQATVIAMKRAVAALGVEPAVVMIDGNYRPKGFKVPVTTLVQGDGRVAQIAAASILAKTSRDRLMSGLDADIPGYHFSQHMGYGTALHLEALRALGPSAVHRRTFEPVRSLLKGGKDDTGLQD